MIQIGKDIRIEASEYKGKFYIGIRKWYEKDGEWLPSSKGITMNVDEWSEFKDHYEEIVADIDAALKG